MATCPSGHTTTSTDFCDVCGLQLTTVGTAPSPPTTEAPSAPAEGGPDTCPVCGEPRTGRFCEGCSYDFVSGVGSAPRPAPTPPPTPPPAPAPTPGPTPEEADAAVWWATIAADRAYYELVKSQGDGDEQIDFPADFAARVVPLVGAEVRIGRRSRSRNLKPEIDMAGPPEDSGVSHVHAVLVIAEDGGLTVVDKGSTNGTTVNGAEDPIEPNVPVALKADDRVHVGAWTTITIHAERPDRLPPREDAQ